jgi:hypothetical protein
MELIAKQQYDAHMRFVSKKLIECDGTLSQKEITNLLFAMTYIATHNNSLERYMRDMEYEMEQLKSDIKNTLNNLSKL